jgi:hypothetical protein
MVAADCAIRACLLRYTGIWLSVWLSGVPGHDNHAPAVLDFEGLVT